MLGRKPLLAVDFLARLRVEAPHDAAIVDDVDVGAVGHRRRHVRPVLERPHDVRLGDVAASAGRITSIGRSRDGAMMSSPCTTGDATMRYAPSLVGFKRVGAPQLLAGVDVVPGHGVAAGDDELEVVAVPHDRRRRVRVGRFRAARWSAAPAARSCDRSPC